MPPKSKPATTTTTTKAGSLDDPRRHVKVEPERVRDVSSTDYPGHYPDEDHSWDLDKFKKNLQVKVTRLSNRSVEFDLIGVDASIANAFRRILIAEVPSIAIEYVYVWNNTSVIVDEVLSHRIGLIPLNVDPARIEIKESPTAQATDRNTIVFKLNATCSRQPVKSTSTNPTPDELYINHEVLSGDLQWVPQGEQADVFVDLPPAPTNPNIVLAKLRPGQEIDAELHAVKSVGKDHAKFSPVATASYRLLPHLTLNPEKPVPPHLADKFAACFSRGVIKVDPKTKKVSVDQKAIRGETMSREVFRHPEFEGCVKLSRVRDYFLFHVESEGAYAPERLFGESVRVMREKIALVRAAAQRLTAGGPDEAPDGDVSMADV